MRKESSYIYDKELIASYADSNISIFVWNFFLEQPLFTSTPSDTVDVPAIRALVRVNCSATGLPLPKITWYKNNVSISVFNNVTRDEVTSELVIGQFQPSDQATYKCVARNMYNDEVNATTNVGKESFIEDFLKVIINCPHAAIIVYVKGTASFFTHVAIIHANLSEQRKIFSF